MKIKSKKAKVLLLTVLLMVLLSSSLTVYASDKHEYNLDIPKLQGLTHTQYSLYRDTSTTSNKWGVKITESTERTAEHSDGSANTATTFWLGIDNPDGVNPMGSTKVIVLESSTGYTKTSAYAAASYKNVFLYASDNAATNSKYSVTGKWYAYT